MKKLFIAILCSVAASTYANSNKIEKVYYTPNYTIIVSSSQPTITAPRATKKCPSAKVAKVACFKPDRPVVRALRRLP
jgi:hypothetical protein